MAPHKNIPRLIEAFRRSIRQEKPSHTHLVLAGGLGRPRKEILEELSLETADLDRVHFTGFVEDDDLAPLYSGAEAFVFPSLYEGFGLPVLEAMQCGCPVVASNTSSLPEIVEDAGILVDPTDTEELAHALSRVVGPPSTISEFPKKGRERAKDYSWESSASGILDVYRQVI